MPSPAATARAAVATGDDRALATVLFAELDPAQADGVVQALLTHPHDGVRSMLLGEAVVACPAVVAAVVPHLDGAGRALLVAAAERLARHRDRPALVAPYATALVTWAHPEAEELLLALLAWPEAPRAPLLTALGKVGSAACIESLSALGTDGAPALAAVCGRLPRAPAGALALPGEIGQLSLAPETDE